MQVTDKMSLIARKKLRDMVWLRSRRPYTCTREFREKRKLASWHTTLLRLPCPFAWRWRIAAETNRFCDWHAVRGKGGKRKGGEGWKRKPGRPAAARFGAGICRKMEKVQRLRILGPMRKSFDRATEKNEYYGLADGLANNLSHCE